MERITSITVLWGLAGLLGVVYAAVKARRMRVQSAYRPVFEDWLFHVLLPFASYAALVISAYAAHCDCAAGPVPRLRDDAAVALHWYSQRLGCSHVLRFCRVETAGLTYELVYRVTTNPHKDQNGGYQAV